MSSGFRVIIGEVKASNGTTWVVNVDHPDRPLDASPWDTEGRMCVFETYIEEHAKITKESWENFLDNK